MRAGLSAFCHTCIFLSANFPAYPLYRIPNSKKIKDNTKC